MNPFDVQAIALNVPRERAFAFIADPANLPQWTNAFAACANGRARLRSPNGEIDVALDVAASSADGTIDWRMKFPDGAIAQAFSRLVPLAPNQCVYSFVLTAPPLPLEQLEGALTEQSRTLREELAKLKRTLEHHG